MIKYIVRQNGKFYLKKWCVFYTLIWDSSNNYWWHLYKWYGTPFNSKEELRAAYRNRSPKFEGFL